MIQCEFCGIEREEADIGYDVVELLRRDKNTPRYYCRQCFDRFYTADEVFEDYDTAHRGEPLPVDKYELLELLMQYEPKERKTA